jgi:drug/metabolite transporter (DMT)-like permease
VTRRYVPLLLLLTGLWGSSFLFIEVALDGVEPTVLIALRLLTAAVVLVPFVALRQGAPAFRRLRAGWQPVVVLGAINAAIPFTLIAWGQKHIDSGIAAIANASVPIFVALLAIRFRPSE